MEKYKSFSLKLVCCWLIVLVAICFCACAKVEAETISNDDGSIDEIARITLDEQKIIESGQNLAIIKDDILIQAKQIVSSYVQWFNDRAYFDIDNKGLYGKVSAIKNFGWDNNVFTAGLHFYNIDAYRYYYQIEEDADNEPEVEKHFLYDKVIVKGSTLYAAYNSLYTSLYEHFSQNYPLLNNEEPELYYTYIMDYRREKSDADFVKKVDGKYYHTWKLSPSETNKEITIYYNLANRQNCILLCVLVSLLISIILLLVGFIIAKYKKIKGI